MASIQIPYESKLPKFVPENGPFNYNNALNYFIKHNEERFDEVLNYLHELVGKRITEGYQPNSNQIQDINKKIMEITKDYKCHGCSACESRYIYYQKMLDDLEKVKDTVMRLWKAKKETNVSFTNISLENGIEKHSTAQRFATFVGRKIKEEPTFEKGVLSYEYYSKSQKQYIKVEISTKNICNCTDCMNLVNKY